MLSKSIPLLYLFWLALCAPVAANAAQTARWYADVALGFNIAENMQFKETGAEAEFDFTAPIGALSVGRYLGEHWRLELEAAHHYNDMETVFWPAADNQLQFDVSDGVRAQSLQLNAIREFRIGALQPYLGGGLGAANIRIRLGEAAVWGLTPRPRQPILDDDAWSAVIQLIAGFNVPLTAKLDLAFDYRLWHAPSFGVTDELGQSYDLEHTTHSGYMHLRYLFSGQRQNGASNLRPSDGRWYLGGSLGSGYSVDAEISDSFENFDAFRMGPVVAFTLGYRLSPHWRLDLEASSRENAIEVIDFNPEIGQFSADGEMKAWSLLMNAVYQFRPEKPIRPFLGFGVGAARLRYDVDTRGQVYVDDSATAPAAQLLAGLDIALSEQLDFVFDYRSWYSTGIDLERPDGRPLGTSHWMHSASVGLRYSL